MAKPFTEWTVLPHGKLTRVDDNLLTVTGQIPMPAMGHVDRRMTVIRLGDGRLVIYSAIALDETEMTVLETWGTPAFLIVPSGLHRMDARTWKDRYPTIEVIAPAGARDKVAEVVPVDATMLEVADPMIQCVSVPGTSDGELALVVETSGGTTLVVNDLIFDLPNRGGVRGWIFEKLGLTGDHPHLPGPVRLRLVKDKQALAAQLERWSKLPDLRRVIISHGAIITDAPAEVLGKVAEDLAA